MNIAVVGAGASGMLAGLQAAWQGAGVTLFERNQTVGQKLLVTGSGHCNLTNAAVSAAAYTCADQAWMETLLNQFGVSDLLDVLVKIGVPARPTADGWYYPLSESAQSVVQAFSSALDLAGVRLCSLAQVRSLRTAGNGLAVDFLRDGRAEQESFDRVIVSAGGTAYPSLGARGELFPELERMGHSVLPKRPALAPLLAELGDLQPLQGMRLDAGVSLWKGSQQLACSKGNLIFTAWGLNGPAVMDVSHFVSAHPGEDLQLSLDLLAFFREQFDQLLRQERSGRMPAGVFLNAFFSPKICLTLLKIAGLAAKTPMQQVSDGALDRLTRQLQDTRLPVRGVRGFEYCQASAGGVPVNEVDPQTMQSRIVEGLFLTGETLDVVGPCGGYNLQYAFSSGAVAGRAAA